MITATLDDLADAYRTRDPALAGHQHAESVALANNHIAVLCNVNLDGYVEQTTLLELADDGSLRWERRYSPSHGAGRAIAALPSGGYAIAGDVRRGELAYQASLLFVDPRGDVVSAQALGPAGATGFRAIAVARDGSILAGGTSAGRGWHVPLDALLDGAVVGITPLGDDIAIAAIRDATTTSFGGTHIAALAADHTPRWQATLSGEPAALASTANELVVVGHGAASSREPAHLWVARLDAAGAPLWERTLGRPNEERRARAIAITPSNDIAIAGDAVHNNHRGLRVALLAPDGTPRWERAFGDGYSLASGIASTPNGLVVVGSTTSNGKTSIWIIRLDLDGRILWERIRNLADR